ncbi:MAG: efflux RND transporter periplasmic adaptor subunit [Fibrobacterota bacterium]|nr:efflux RND transporter periplasmic adaptor subunit [Fibrobacterota bacterium]
MRHGFLRSGLAALCILGLSACDKKAETAGGAQGEPATRAMPEAQTNGGNDVESAVAKVKKCPHNAFKTECFICDAALREKGRLWCKEHDRYEDRCFLCHPEIKEEGRLYCQEHGLYEDECFLCHPELKKTGQVETGGEDAVKTHAIGAPGLFCKEHRVLESDCGICHPDLLAALQPGQGLKVRLASVQSANKGGVETGKPDADESEGGQAFLSRVAYNQNQFAHITSLVPGVVRTVHVDFGTQVKKGQVLVEIASPDIARAKSAYLTALSELNLKELAYQREKGLAEKNVSSRQEFEQAEAEFRRSRNETASARQELINFGISETDLSALVKTGATTSSLSIRAPFAGTVIERKAVPGEAVTPEAPLFALADLSSMWLELSIPSDAGAGLQVGDPVAAVFDALPGVQIPGNIIWVSSGIDETSRMLKARALVRNPKGILKDGMFGKVRIPGIKGGKRLGLPSGAVQHIDGADYVFVKLEEDLYEIRKVWLEDGLDGRFSLLDGLASGEEVVLTGSFAMKTEFLKSRLGAGCTDGH